MTYSTVLRHGYAPLRIVARMDEPIGYLGDLLHLDGPLAYAVYHDFDERTRKMIPAVEESEFPRDFVLPLSTWWADYDPDQHGDVDARLLTRRKSGTKGTDPQLWGWCATAADEEAWGIRSKLEVRKKPAIKEMGRYTDAKAHNVSSGHMKAYDLAIPTVFSRAVTWYAHGDAHRIRHLLSTYVPALGKKRSTGSGTVREWIVEESSPHDGVIIEGRLMRRMPASTEQGFARLGAIRPPYYHHTRIVGAVEPC